MAVPKDHLRRFHRLDDAKRFGHHQTRFVESFGRKGMIGSKTPITLDALGAVYQSLFDKHKASHTQEVIVLTTLPLPKQHQLLLWSADEFAMTSHKDKKFTKKSGRRPIVEKNHVAFDKKKIECFNCHNTGLLPGCQVISYLESRIQKRTQSCSNALTVNNELIDCGMSSTVKLGLGHSIKSNAEVLGYEEEISRGIFVLRETDAGYYDIPLYSRFKQVEYKGVPHPLSGDYTPREQEDIDDSLYVYGKYGPQPQSPSPTVSNASSISFSICPSNDSDGDLGTVSGVSSTHYSTCQSNDSVGEPGTVSDHSVNDDPVSTQKTQPKVPTPTQTVDPSCAQHVKPPRQQNRTPVTSSPIPLNNRQNWNQRMQKDLGAGYSFERKPCFVCGSLSHLIKNCDYYEKKMAREAALKSKRVVHTNDRQATPAWNNTNRVNKANQFTPRPVNVRPNLSTASNTIKTGRVNVNTGHGNVNSGSVHVNAGTQVKSGTSRFNTGKQHVNSGSVYVNSVTQIKSAASRVNTGKRYINSGCVHINTARVNRPVSNKPSPKPSQRFHNADPILEGLANPAGSKEVIDIDMQTEEATDLMVVSSTSLTEATRKAAVSKKIATKKPSSTPIYNKVDVIKQTTLPLDFQCLQSSKSNLGDPNNTLIRPRSPSQEDPLEAHALVSYIQTQQEAINKDANNIFSTAGVNTAELNTGETERVQRRKGKDPMTEEDLQAEVQASKKTREQELQELAGLEAAQKLQATMDAETQRQIDLDALLARRLVEQEEEAAKEALATEFDYIQARLNADQILAEKIQQEEREQYSIEERAKFLHDTIAAQRKFLAEQRYAAIRNKPPTISQLRNQMITYLKHVANKKHAELKSKSFEEIQVLYERCKKQNEIFVAFGSKEDERAIKKMNEQAAHKEKEQKAESVHEEVKEEEGAKKRKLGTRRKLKAKRRKHASGLTREDDDLKICLHIAPDEDKVIDVEILDHQYPIVEWQSFFLTTKPQYDQTKPEEDIYMNKVTRSNGRQRFFRTLMGVLSILDREDLKTIYELVMEKYQDEIPEGFDKMLWGDLIIMFNQGDTADFWNEQLNWKIISWKLHSSSGVHTIMTSNGLVIHMLVENRYPLTKEVLSQLLDLKLETEEESTMALELIKFVKQQLEEFGDSDDDVLAKSDHDKEERV
ncbi:hypothetical protein Tco_0424511 [Tanacetum coccineum]